MKDILKIKGKNFKLTTLGFTLIELLAVIVILAIIALIATPIILNIIGSSKKSAVLRSGELYLKNVETTIARENLKTQLNPTRCTIKVDGNLTCIDKDNKETDIIIESTGNKPSSGTIILEKGKITEVTDVKLDGYVLEKEEGKRLTIKGEAKDETPAEVKININKRTTNSITITVEALDNESGIKEYQYSIDGINYTTGSNVYTLNSLNSGETYKIYVKVINGTNLETKKEIEVTTLAINIPTYEIDNGDWSKSKKVTIIYPIVEGQNLIYEYSLDNGENWNVATQIQEIVFTSNGTVIARVTDGQNKINGATFTVNKIDTTAPTILSVIGNDGETTSNKVLVVNAEDNESGIKEYSFDNGVSWQTSNSKTITENGTYNIKVKDNLDNISEATSIVVSTIVPAPDVSIKVEVFECRTLSVDVTIANDISGISKIEYNYVDDNWVSVGTNKSFNISGLTKGKEYTIRVRVTSKNGSVVVTDGVKGTPSGVCLF